MTNLLSLSFWFKMNPGALMTISRNALIFLILCFLFLTIFFYFKQKTTGKSKQFILVVWRGLYNLSLVNMFFALFLFFFCYQQISFFSSRFWFLVWGIEVIVWLFFIFKIYKGIPLKIAQAESSEKYQKYIP